METSGSADWTADKGAVLNKIEEDRLLVDFSVPANDTYIVRHYRRRSALTIRLENNTRQPT